MLSLKIGLTCLFIGIALVQAGVLTVMLDDPKAQEWPAMASAVRWYAYFVFPVLCAALSWVMSNMKAE